MSGDTSHTLALPSSQEQLLRSDLDLTKRAFTNLLQRLDPSTKLDSNSLVAIMSENQQLKYLLKSKEQDLSVSARAFKELLDQLKVLKENNYNKTSVVSDTNGNLNDVKNELLNTQKEIRRKDSKIIALTSLLKDIESKLLESGILSPELAQHLRRELKSWSLEVNELMNVSLHTQEEQEETAKRFEQTHADLVSARNEINSLCLQLNEISEEKDDHRRLLEEAKKQYQCEGLLLVEKYENTIAHLQNETESIQLSKNIIINELNDEKARNQLISERLVQLQSEGDTIKNKNNEFNIEIKNLKMENIKLQNELSVQLNVVQSLNSQFEQKSLEIISFCRESDNFRVRQKENDRVIRSLLSDSGPSSHMAISVKSVFQNFDEMSFQLKHLISDAEHCKRVEAELRSAIDNDLGGLQSKLANSTQFLLSEQSSLEEIRNQKIHFEKLLAESSAALDGVRVSLKIRENQCDVQLFEITQMRESLKKSEDVIANLTLKNGVSEERLIAIQDAQLVSEKHFKKEIDRLIFDLNNRTEYSDQITLKLEEEQGNSKKIQNELSIKSKEYDELRQSNHDLENKLRDALNSCSSQTILIEALQKEVASSDHQKQLLFNDISTLQKQYEDLNKQLPEIVKHQENMKIVSQNDINVLSSRNEQYLDEIQSLQKHMQESLQSQRNHFVNEIASVISKNDELTQEIHNLKLLNDEAVSVQRLKYQNDLNTANMQNDELKREILRHFDFQNHLQDELKNLQADKKDLLDQISSISNLLNTLQASILKYQENLSDSNNDRKKLTDDLYLKSEAFNTLKHEFEIEKAVKQKEIELLYSNLSALQTKLLSMEQATADLASRLNEATFKEKQFVESISASNENIGRLQTNLNLSEIKCRNGIEEFNLVKNEHKEVCDQLKSAEHNLGKVHDELNVTKHALENIQRELKQSQYDKAHLSHEVNILNTDRASLQALCDSLTNQVTNLTNALSIAEERVVDVATQQDVSLSNTISYLLESLQSLQLQSQNIRHDINNTFNNVNNQSVACSTMFDQQNIQKQRIDQLYGDFMSVRDAYISMEHNFTQQLISTKSELSDALSTKAALLLQIRSLSDYRDSAESKSVSLQSQILSAQARLVTLNDRVQEMGNKDIEIRRLSSELADVTAKLEAETRRREAAVEKCASLRSELAVSSKNNDKKDEVDRLRSLLRRCEADLSASQAATKVAEDRRFHAENELARLQETARELRTSIRDLNAEKAAFNNTVSEIPRLRSQLGLSTAEITDMRSQLASANDRIAVLTSDSIMMESMQKESRDLLCGAFESLVGRIDLLESQIVAKDKSLLESSLAASNVSNFTAPEPALHASGTMERRPMHFANPYPPDNQRSRVPVSPPKNLAIADLMQRMEKLQEKKENEIGEVQARINRLTSALDRVSHGEEKLMATHHGHHKRHCSHPPKPSVSGNLKHSDLEYKKLNDADNEVKFRTSELKSLVKDIADKSLLPSKSKSSGLAKEWHRQEQELRALVSKLQAQEIQFRDAFHHKNEALSSIIEKHKAGV